eukprot:6213141-Pleurochrysis_carterae.AAC.5
MPTTARADVREAQGEDTRCGLRALVPGSKWRPQGKARIRVWGAEHRDASSLRISPSSSRQDRHRRGSSDGRGRRRGRPRGCLRRRARAHAPPHARTRSPRTHALAHARTRPLTHSRLTHARTRTHAPSH